LQGIKFQIVGATAATATAPHKRGAAHKEKTNTNEKIILASVFLMPWLPIVPITNSILSLSR
jgi:hypothetical protein